MRLFSILIAAFVIMLGFTPAMAAVIVTKGPAGQNGRAVQDPAKLCTGMLNQHRIQTLEEKKGAPIKYTDEEKASIQECIKGRDKSNEKTLREYWLKNRDKPAPTKEKTED